MKRILALFLCCLFLTGCAQTAPTETLPTSEEITDPTTSETGTPTEEPSAPTEDPESPTEEPSAPTDETKTPTEKPSPPAKEPESPTKPSKNPTPSDPIAECIQNMTLEERVGQLFLARCPTENALADIETYHFGGYVLFAQDFKDETPDSVAATISAYQDAASIPMLIAVDEEGGTVTRVSRYPAFRDTPFRSPRDLYAEGGLEAVLDNEAEKSKLLSSLGINVNLAPVCDITTDPNAFMYPRSLGESPEATGEYVQKMLVVMQRNGVGGVLKHFPGYGNNTDTHIAIAIDDRSLETLESCDLVPFQMGMEVGCGAIMVSHTFINALDSELPATLSPTVNAYIRKNMSYNGILITDDLVMQAITDLYGAGEAAVMAVNAGNDMLCSTEYQTQYAAVLEAVQDGRISEERINESVYRILKWKYAMELMQL